MTGELFIDGVDVYDMYGVFVEGNGFDGLLGFPAMVPPDSNDWAEEHGIEVDLSEPKLQAREFTMYFAHMGVAWELFYEFMATPGIRVLSVPALAKSWQVRVVEMTKLEEYNGVDLLSVKFAEDSIEVPAGYPSANASGLLTSVVSLDGKTLDKYGIILTGGLDDLAKAPKLKTNLTRTALSINGQEYDSGMVRYSQKQVTFKCCLNAVQTADFNNLYNAFFGDLLKPGLRKIGYKGKSYDAYYSHTANWKLLTMASQVVCEFDVTLIFTAFVIGRKTYLLASQDDLLISTEEGILIDLNY